MTNAPNPAARMFAGIIGLRALLMLIAGLFAVLFPVVALTVLVILGGALFLVDGALGLWSLTFGGAKTGNFWFDIVRNALSLALGVLILISPMVATLVTTTFLIYVIAFQAILVGVMEIAIVWRERQSYARIWPVLLSGALYVLFGIALVFSPLLGAVVLVIIGGLLMIMFSIALFAMAWRVNKMGRATG